MNVAIEAESSPKESEISKKFAREAERRLREHEDEIRNIEDEREVPSYLAFRIAREYVQRRLESLAYTDEYHQIVMSEMGDFGNDIFSNPIKAEREKLTQIMRAEAEGDSEPLRGYVEAIGNKLFVRNPAPFQRPNALLGKNLLRISGLIPKPPAPAK